MKFLFFKKKNATQYALDGEFLRKKRKYKKSLYNLNRAINLDKTNDMFYYSRSKTKFCLKDIKGAIIDIEQAINIQPSVRIYSLLKEKYLRVIEEINNRNLSI